MRLVLISMTGIPHVTFLLPMIYLVLTDIDQLITIGGMVIRNSNLIPEMGVAFFRCYVCHNTAEVHVTFLFFECAFFSLKHSQ